MSSKDADSVKWILIPLTTNLIGADGMYNNDEMSIDAPTPNPKSTPSLGKKRHHILSLDSNDDMSIVSTPVIGHDNQPFINVRGRSGHDDMSIASPSATDFDNQPFSIRDSQPVRPRSYSDQDNMSISTSANGVLPFANSTNDSPLGVNISLSRFFDKEEGWSLFMPSHEETNIEINTPEKTTLQTPTLFRAMSIESMYSVWSNGTSFAGDVVEDGERPNKRLKSVERNIDHDSTDKNGGNFKRYEFKCFILIVI